MRSRPFSLATDASNDKNEKLFPIVIRLEMDGKVKTVLPTIEELQEKGSGKNISELILKVLSDRQIPIQNCMALATDNDNDMVGSKSGVYGHLREIHEHLYLTGCVCHRYDLAADWAIRQLPKDIEKFFLDIYYFMEKSSDRLQQFKSYQLSCGTPVTAVVKHCPTRWLSLGKMCAWVLEQWEPLKKFFKAQCLAEKNTAKSLGVKKSSSRKHGALDHLPSRTSKLLCAFFEIYNFKI